LFIASLASFLDLAPLLAFPLLLRGQPPLQQQGSHVRRAMCNATRGSWWGALPATSTSKAHYSKAGKLILDWVGVWEEIFIFFFCEASE